MDRCSITQDKIAVQKDTNSYMLWRVLSREHLRDIGHCLSAYEYRLTRTTTSDF
jgi:hypothetical protein